MPVSEAVRAGILEKFQLFQGGTGGLDSWLGEKTPEVVFEALAEIREKPLHRAGLNQLLTLSHEAPVSDAFLHYYWLSEPADHPYKVRKIRDFDERWPKSAAIADLNQLSWGLYRFYVDALLYFGNIRTAYQRLRGLSEKELFEFFLKRRIDTEGLSKRGEPVGLEEIAKDNRYLISEMACKSFAPSGSDDGIVSVLTELLRQHNEAGGSRITIGKLLKQAYANGQLKNRQLEFELSSDDFHNKIVRDEAELLSVIAPTSREFSNARAIALENTKAYLSMVGDLDAYVATSMRSRQDFRNMSNFCDAVFKDTALQDFKLRHFDPTLSAAKHHEDKGLIECLMVKCAKVLVLHAGGSDSYGKDAEVAMALSLGKPVIIYSDDPSRISLFRDVHPLSRLINFETGVATGAMIATSHGMVVNLLRRIFSNEMEYELEQQHPNYLVLKEELTGSVVRLQTSDDLLRETFWNHYHHDAR